MSSATRYGRLLGFALAGLIVVACSPAVDPSLPPSTTRSSRRHPRHRPPPHRRQPLASQPSRRPLIRCPPPPPSGPPSTAGGRQPGRCRFPRDGKRRCSMVATRKAFGATAPGCTRSSLRRTRCDRPRLCRRPHATTTPTRGSPRRQLPKSIRRRRDRPVLEFDDEQAATHYFSSTADRFSPAPQEMSPYTPRLCRGVGGLVDRRTYPDSKWTEIAEQNGRRITLIILSDPSHAINKASAQRILDQIHG